MTCIAALETTDGVWIGADSQIGAWCREALSVPKFHEAAPGVVFGVAGHWRMTTVLRHRWKPDAPTTDTDLDEWVFNATEDFRRLLNEHGAAKHENGEHNASRGDSQALIVVNRRAYSIGSGFSYFRSQYGYTAIGSGEPFALGSFATTVSLGLPPEVRMRLALDAAARHNDGTSGPLTIRFVEARR